MTDDGCICELRRDLCDICGQCVGCGCECDLMDRPWRVGRSLRRTLYAQIGPEASKRDIVLGMVDTPELAAHIVAVHNATLEET